MAIQVLPQSLADKIAAGEVVERPASVVKELVENSLDAGATNISVEIKRGGITFIRVTDDGCGMAREEAKTAFLRHATSKISQDEDLNAIETYGFRGEALAAISAVSEMELITCSDSARTAYYLKLAAGIVVEEDEIGAAKGTTMMVHNLFYNTPARLHFLKKDATEAAAIATMLEKIAIARYDVSFSLISDGKKVFQTNKTDDMRDAIHAIYGASVSKELMPIEHSYKGNRMIGYACKPNVMRGSRNMQHIFLNGRSIRSAALSKAIDAAYSANRETGKHAVCFIGLEIDPQNVDVNVHPAKLEVKFRDEQAVFTMVKYGLLTAIEKLTPFGQLRSDVLQKPVVSAPFRDISPEPAFAAPQESEQQTLTVVPAFSAQIHNPEPILAETVSSSAKPAPTIYSKDEISGYIDIGLVDRLGETASREFRESRGIFIEEPEEEILPLDGMTILGEIFKVYIVLEYNDTLYLVDKHAAHEKMIYNSLLKEMTDKGSQRLLTMETLSLSAEDMDAALTHKCLFYERGFDFYESDTNEIVITAVPAIFDVKKESPTKLFGEYLTAFRSERDRTQREYDMLKMRSCRDAIKGGSESKPEELQALINELVLSRDVCYCPHGRPVVMKFSHQEIDKMFKRLK